MNCEFGIIHEIFFALDLKPSLPVTFRDPQFVVLCLFLCHHPARLRKNTKKKVMNQSTRQSDSVWVHAAPSTRRSLWHSNKETKMKMTTKLRELQ